MFFKRKTKTKSKTHEEECEPNKISLELPDDSVNLGYCLFFKTDYFNREGGRRHFTAWFLYSTILLFC